MMTLYAMAVGITAMIETSRAVSARPTAGLGLELDTIAAVVIGAVTPNQMARPKAQTDQAR